MMKHITWNNLEMLVYCLLFFGLGSLLTSLFHELRSLEQQSEQGNNDAGKGNQPSPVSAEAAAGANHGAGQPGASVAAAVINGIPAHVEGSRLVATTPPAFDGVHAADASNRPEGGKA